MSNLTQQQVQSLFDYRDGFLYWKVRKAKNTHIGDKAGYLDVRYYRITINGKQYLNHQLIFLHNKGFIPTEIDHIDGNSLNNRIENLRAATRSQNNMNRKSHKNKSSIYKGINWNKNEQKWRAVIGINGKQKHLGYFKSESNAAFCYNIFAKELHKEYAVLNEIKEE